MAVALFVLRIPFLPTIGRRFSAFTGQRGTYRVTFRDKMCHAMFSGCFSKKSERDRIKKDSGWKTFASRVVQQKAVDILRRHYSAKEKFLREMVSLNTSVSFDGEEMEIIQLIPDQGKQISPDMKHDIDSTIESLDRELRKMCLALKEMSLREYCSLYHVSRFTANRRLAKLRNIFGKTF